MIEDGLVIRQGKVIKRPAALAVQYPRWSLFFQVDSHTVERLLDPVLFNQAIGNRIGRFQQVCGSVARMRFFSCAGSIDTTLAKAQIRMAALGLFMVVIGGNGFLSD